MFSPRTQELICAAGLAPLPIVEIEALATAGARIWLKQEWDDPYGPDPLRSIKRKPACLLTADLVEKRQVDSGRLAISATSGNLGIEVGLIAALEGFPFLAVVPEHVPVQNMEIMLELGVDVVQTTETGACPGDLTVFFARGCAAEYRTRLVNIEQYASWLNPLSHSALTARELFEAFEQPVDHVVTPVGSCGTLGGLYQYLLATGRLARLVGVQAVGEGLVPGIHAVAGDRAWTPENFSPAVLPADCVRTADAVDAYAFATKLWACGIPVGPSTGLALAQAYRLARSGLSGNLVVISPDSNFKYGDVISDALRELRVEILARYPELEIDDAIDAYAEEMREAYGLGHTLQRVRQCYPVEKRGQLYSARDVRDIVWAVDPAARAQRRDEELDRGGDRPSPTRPHRVYPGEGYFDWEDDLSYGF